MMPRLGAAYTELVTPKVAGDPQLHTHACGAECGAHREWPGRWARPCSAWKGVHEWGGLY
jgi:hypothetical protein